jgi:hypothetical protein
MNLNQETIIGKSLLKPGSNEQATLTNIAVLKMEK